MGMSGIGFYLSAKLIDDGDENWLTGHNIEPDDMILFLIAITVGINNAGMLVPIVHYITEGITSANKMNELISTNDSETGDVEYEIKGGLTFNNVSFAYPLKPSHYVLRNVNFSIFPGQFLGIAGETGSGKSTVV